MVKTGHPPIRQVRFQNPRVAALGVDLLSLAELRRKAPGEWLARPERLEFHMFLYCTAGEGGHRVDFQRYPVRRGTVVWVRPWQVQQWELNATMRGRLLLIDPGRGPAPPRGAAWLELPSARQAGVGEELDRIGEELAAYRGDETSARRIWHLVSALLLEFERAAGPASPAGEEPEVLRLLKGELEEHFARHRTVAYYARRLGYSEKTLTRACLRAEGRTAKEMIDDRVVLEAKRLLAHGGGSAAEIGARLGFGEATNFAKFFQRAVGVTPGAFRAAI